MTTRRMRSLAAVAALALFALASPLATRPASAQGAEPDTTLHDFLDSLADSTDHYFGKSAAATDTAGLDSALAYGLEHPRRPRSSLQLQAMPDFGFNRADGPVWGGWVAIGAPRALGELRGSAGYAVGPNEWLGDGRYRKSIRHDGAIWDWDIVGGRSTASMEREHPSLRLASVRALVNGKDRKHYLRVDGFETGIARVANTWHAGIRFRDQLERPLATTTTWNLFHSTLSLFDNLAATRGRAREFEYEFGIRTPYLPLSIEAKHQTASDAIGSDFEYRRYRVAVAGNFGLGRLAAAVPQVVYGRLHGGATPQQSFYLGGAHTLRSLPGTSRGGTGTAVARLDVIGTFDLLEALHIPHPAAFPLQGGLFGAIGSVWGIDPFRANPFLASQVNPDYERLAAPTSADESDWPERNAWVSEVGVSLIYQPGIPDPTSAIRLNYAIPIGPIRDGARLSLSFTRAFDVLRSSGD